MKLPDKSRKIPEHTAALPKFWPLVLFFSAFGLFFLRETILDSAMPAREWSAYNLGREAGSAFMLIVLPCVIAAVWWRIGKFAPGEGKQPLILWASLIAIFGFTSVRGAVRESYPEAFANYIYQDTNCEFQVGFPARPGRANEQSGALPNERELATKNALLRAVCFKLGATFNRDEKSVSELMTELGRELQDVTVRYNVQDGVAVGVARGTKRTGRNDVLYEIRLYIGEKSALSVTTAGLAKYYPPMEVTRFIRSVKRAKVGES